MFCAFIISREKETFLLITLSVAVEGVNFMFRADFLIILSEAIIFREIGASLFFVRLNNSASSDVNIFRGYCFLRCQQIENFQDSFHEIKKEKLINPDKSREIHAANFSLWVSFSGVLVRSLCITR